MYGSDEHNQTWRSTMENLTAQFSEGSFRSSRVVWPFLPRRNYFKHPERAASRNPFIVFYVVDMFLYKPQIWEPRASLIPTESNIQEHRHSTTPTTLYCYPHLHSPMSHCLYQVERKMEENSSRFYTKLSNHRINWRKKERPRGLRASSLILYVG